MGASYLPSSSSEEEELQDRVTHHPSGKAALGGKDELDSRIQGAGNGGLPRKSLDPQEAFESDSETLEFGHQFINIVDSGRRSLEVQVQ